MFELIVNPAFVAIALGLSLGALLGYWGIKRVAARFGNGQGLRASIGIGGALAVFPAFFLSVVLGGSFGGGYGEALFGPVGMSIGLCVGIAVVMAAVIALGAVAGVLFGGLVACAASRLS